MNHSKRPVLLVEALPEYVVILDGFVVGNINGVKLVYFADFLSA